MEVNKAGLLEKYFGRAGAITGGMEPMHVKRQYRGMPNTSEQTIIRIVTTGLRIRTFRYYCAILLHWTNANRDRGCRHCTVQGWLLKDCT